MKAKLILENGMEFEGRAFGAIKETYGEVVFNTSMTGYQEIMTDPSYYGQIVTFTYPLIGNYGLNIDDVESRGIKVSGIIIREKANNPSNFRYEFELSDYLEKNNTLGLSGIDTRALTKVLRNEGSMKGVITLHDFSEEDVKEEMKKIDLTDAVEKVTCNEFTTVGEGDTHIVLVDCGTKKHIVEDLASSGAKVTVVPASTTSNEIVDLNPDGIFLSNGPGDPKDATTVIETTKSLIGKYPICGICLGHQILALALGGDTEKLPFGHRGANHPVKDLRSKRVLITSQNHGYVVVKDSLPESVEVTHVSLNDYSVEGIEDKKNNLYSVQFHPEACPGPLDAKVIFDEFLSFIRGDENA